MQQGPCLPASPHPPLSPAITAFPDCSVQHAQRHIMHSCTACIRKYRGCARLHRAARPRIMRFRQCPAGRWQCGRMTLPLSQLVLRQSRFGSLPRLPPPSSCRVRRWRSSGSRQRSPAPLPGHPHRPRSRMPPKRHRHCPQHLPPPTAWQLARAHVQKAKRRRTLRRPHRSNQGHLQEWRPQQRLKRHRLSHGSLQPQRRG